MAIPVSFPSTTPGFSLPLLFTGQAQKEFFLNQSLSTIDACMQFAVVSSETSPPAGPNDGECYRVTGAATGDWTGHEDDIAILIGGAWQFIKPANGMRIYDREIGAFIIFDSGWHTPIEPAQPTSGATIDDEVRTALSQLIQALRTAGIFENP